MEISISKGQYRFLIISIFLSWGLFITITFVTFKSFKEKDVLTVKRINVINDDGTVVMAISNKQRIAAPRMNGKEYPIEMIERQHYAGIIFFNEKGDEVGGLIFNSNELPDGRKYGGGHLSFDRYNDNQVVNLEYKENIHGLVKSGISVLDRTGNGSFGRNLDLLHEYKYDSISDIRKEQIVSELNALKKSGDLGVERIFMGSENEISKLVMKDKLGRIRVMLYIDSTNVAKLQFFNEYGKIINEFPNKK